MGESSPDPAASAALLSTPVVVRQDLGSRALGENRLEVWVEVDGAPACRVVLTDLWAGWGPEDTPPPPEAGQVYWWAKGMWFRGRVIGD